MPSRKYPAHRRNGVSLTDEERAKAKQLFLDAFARTGNLTQSADYAKVSRATVYDWKESDPDFLARFTEAEHEASDRIRGEIYRRGVEGWDEPVVSAGKVVTTVRRYSDRMLELMARARLPEYREQHMDVTSGGLPIASANTNYALILASPELSELAARIAEAPVIDASGTRESDEQ